MGSEILLEVEGLFDLLLVHGDVADTVHQAVVLAAQVHPQFAGQPVGVFIHPVVWGHTIKI